MSLRSRSASGHIVTQPVLTALRTPAYSSCTRLQPPRTECCAPPESVGSRTHTVGA
jgi:hypothetical protein